MENIANYWDGTSSGWNSVPHQVYPSPSYAAGAADVSCVSSSFSASIYCIGGYSVSTSSISRASVKPVGLNGIVNASYAASHPYPVAIAGLQCVTAPLGVTPNPFGNPVGGDYVYCIGGYTGIQYFPAHVVTAVHSTLFYWSSFSTNPYTIDDTPWN
jgi:hypothetical protein